MSLSAWLALFVLEVGILLLYFQDELRLVAFRRRYSLERDGRSFRGTIEGRTVLLPNLRNVNEDVEIQVHVPVDVGQLRQAAEPSDDFEATFRLEADPDVRYGLWSGDAERLALELAKLGAFGTSTSRVLSLRVPRTRRFRDGPRSIALLTALGNLLVDREARLVAVLREDLALPLPRALGALAGLIHRNWATPSEIEAMLVPLIDGTVPVLRDRAARIADLYEVPATVTETLARHAPRDAVWTGGDRVFHGCVARAVVRLGRLEEAEAIRWLDAQVPVIDVALDRLAATGGAVAYQAVRATMARPMTTELREHVLGTLAKIRERLPSLGEGQLTLSAVEGGDLAVATDAGALALAKDGA